MITIKCKEIYLNYENDHAYVKGFSFYSSLFIVSIHETFNVFILLSVINTINSSADLYRILTAVSRIDLHLSSN